MRMDIVMAKTSIRGERTAVRMIIIKAICTLVTSVVRRVTREEVENLSMFENEKLWTLANRSCRRFRAKPAPAEAANQPERMPQLMEPMAISTSSAP